MRCVCLLALSMSLTVSPRTYADDASARAVAQKLFGSLNAEQKTLADKDVADKERAVEDFRPVARPGLPFTDLTAAQKALVEELIRAVLSENGAKNCLAVLAQSIPERQYLNFFGDPTAGKPFACRIAAHHLTATYDDPGNGPAERFGPVLLGGKPGSMWDAEEQTAIDLYAALSSTERLTAELRGIKVADLNAKAKPLAEALVAKRLELFSADRRKVLSALIGKAGGIDGLRLSFSGDPSKSHHRGGKPSWLLANPRMAFERLTVGKDHIHMTVRVSLK